MVNTQASPTPDVRSSILQVGQRIMSGKGFSAVGLNEILTAANVPKGSFYHYFSSKDGFGVAMLNTYFDDYLADMDMVLGDERSTPLQRLQHYFTSWRASQASVDCEGKCLAVKLGAEVADLSDAMRAVLDRGTAAIIARLAVAIEAGVADGSLRIEGAPQELAAALYQLWLGASVMVKIVRTPAPFDSALALTQRLLRRD